MPEPVVLAPTPPRLPRTNLAQGERDAAYAAGQRLLEAAAKRSRVLGRFKARAATPEADRLKVLDRLRLDAQKQTRALTERLQRGELSRDAWYRQMRTNLGPYHYAAEMAGTGQTSLDLVQRAAANGRLRTNVGYLARFRADIGVGNTPLDGRVLARADLHAAAVSSTGAAARAEQAGREGHTEERGVLGKHDSCESCVDRASQGWVKIGTLLPIGAGICRSRCGCHIEYRGGTDGAATQLPGRQRSTREQLSSDPELRQPSIAARSPTPLPELFGPTRATIKHTDYAESEVLRSAKATFGRDVSLRDIASAAGAPHDATVEIAPSSSGHGLDVFVNGPGYTMQREITRTVISDQTVIKNHSFFVEPSHQGKGIGSEAFGRQVEQASKLGVDRITTHAAGRHDDPSVVGSKVWPRLGYDGPIPERLLHDARFGGIPPVPGGAEVLSDLMKTKEGREWWDRNRRDVDLKFDLKPGSESRAQLVRYQEEKKVSPETSRTSPTRISAPRRGPGTEPTPFRPQLAADPQPSPKPLSPPLPGVLPGIPVLPGRPMAERLAAYTEGDRKINELAALAEHTRIARREVREANFRIESLPGRVQEETDPAEKARLRAVYNRSVETRAKHQEEINRATAAARSRLHEIAGAARPQVWEHSGDGLDHPKIGAQVRGSEAFLGPLMESYPGGRPATVTWKARTKSGYRANWDGKQINLHASDDVSVAVHERGHHIEEKFPGIGHQSRQFLKHRVGDESLKPMSDLGPGFQADEKGRDDKFGQFFGEKNARYVGKHYDGGDTEVLAMGLQALHDDPVGFAQKDPEYAKWVLGVLDGSLR